ncbi:GNAT family N-acetyltransferase [Planobispora longispora]|uniref:N-acetyltransferase GCN5 n=1 Tax=Planobispora longispora TaxID=28887 RepID=A0A8J3RPA0_9ACTN|nr:GNAT family N-acetyltransferase [Planobispora longispora]BFE85391.1 GNAT family N-acetyltransferase [Planobispora longispora]GIH80321.1 N-acetyltransferase GCN5 [Planobispora longispora]
MKLAAVERLDRDHRLEEFDCGSQAQNDWLRRQALQSQFAETARVYAVRDVDADEVMGYYALTAGQVRPDEVPVRWLKGVGLYAQPVVLLARLGVDLRAQGRGLGRALVTDAMRRVMSVADRIGVRALLIHCEDESARDFCLRLARFENSPADPLQLILRIKDLRRAVAASVEPGQGPVGT